MMRVNIGCGNVHKKGYLNVDRNPKYDPDLLWDVDEPVPTPISDWHVTEIVCENVLEHVKDPFSVLQKFHMICEPGAIITVRVPYFNSVTAAGDLTHKNFFGFTSFDCLNEYSSLKFRIVEVIDEPGFVGKFMPRKLRRLLSYYVGNLIRALVIKLEVVK